MKLYIDTKPELEWEETLGYHMAETPFGTYTILQLAESEETFMIIGLTDDVKAIPNCDTLDQAKSTAQADYERRTAERFRVVEVPEGHVVIDGVAYRLIIKDHP